MKALFVGILYAAIGIAFAALAGSSSMQMRQFWRLAAWEVSAAVFAAHVAYEHFGMRRSPGAVALKAGGAAAVGGFGLALAAMLHSLVALAPDRRPRLLGVALVAWPVITGVPAYIIALGSSAILGRLRRVDSTVL